MNRSSSRNTQRMIAIFVVFLTTVAVVGWFVLFQRPALAQIETLEEQLRAVNADLSRAQQISRSLPELRSTVEQLERSRSDFLQQLPTTRDVASVIDTLYLAAERSSVTLSSVNQGGGQGGVSGVAPIGFSLNATGTWANTLFFLNHVENLQQFTKIHNVSFSGGGSSADPELTVSFNLSVYTLTPNGDWQ